MTMFQIWIDNMTKAKEFLKLLEFNDNDKDLGSVDISKDSDNMYSVYHNSKKLRGGFPNYHLAAEWAANHFEVDPDVFREDYDVLC